MTNWLALPSVDLSLSDSSVWQSVLAGAGVIAFGGLFLQVVMTQRPPLVPLAAMTTIASVLTLAAIDSFALMFVYVASAAAVRMSGRDAALAVGGVTAVAAATLALTKPEGARPPVSWPRAIRAAAAGERVATSLPGRRATTSPRSSETGRAQPRGGHPGGRGAGLAVGLSRLFQDLRGGR
jgi:hypothetical protein